MIIIPIIESMDSILSEMPNLVNRLERNSSDLKNECINFVKKLEASAEKYRLPIVGQLSVIRGKILCGESESVNSSVCISRKERRSQKQRFILEQLEAAYNCVNQYLADSRRIFAECERTVCQITVRLMAKGLLKDYDVYNVSGKTLVQLASSDCELAPTLIQIIGLIGALNTNIIFEKTMSLAGIYNKEE